MPQKIYLLILKTGIYLSFLSVFLVSGKLLFPYITSKQIYFNILIEILFIFWLALIIQYPVWRPKKSWISIGLIGYFLAILTSSIFSVDFNLSFWGDIERMLGFFHILHFLIFYFIIITVFRSKEDWRNLFITSVIAGVIITIYSYAKIAYSTIGNTAYVSGFMIFNIYFALILFFNELKKGWKNNWLVYLYPVAILIMLSVFKQTHTRGAYVGLGIGVAVVLLLYVLLSQNRKIKIYSLSFLALAVISVLLVFMNPQSSIVRNSSILNTITQISGEAVTFQTRLISWKAAAKDFKNHPMLGTGYGNFAITFDKYFDPTFYNYTRSETYFDRAHNNLVDIVSTTGLVGIITYLLIFSGVGYYLVSGYRKEKIGLHEFVLLTSLITAYFVQNLVVFDSLVTYIPLMVTLGFVYWLSDQEQEASYEKDRSFDNKELLILVVAGFAIITVLFQYNIEPLKMLKGTIDGQIAFAQGRIIEGTDIYKKALSYNTPLDRDSRDSFVRAIANSGILVSMERDKANEILDYAISLAERNIEYNSNDSLMHTMLAQVLSRAGDLNKDNLERSSYYLKKAEEAINKSIEYSPGRIPLYFQKAQVYLFLGDNDRAIEVLKFAVTLNEDFYESTCRLARIQIILGKDGGYNNLDKCIDIGGVSSISQTGFIGESISYYAGKEDYTRAIKLNERLGAIDPSDPSVWVNLAALYAQIGNKEKAIEAAMKVSELDPSLKSEVDNYIRNLE